MFKFTSTNVINSNTDFTTGATPLFSGNADSFNVKRVNNFKTDNIVKIFHAPYVAPRLSYAELDLKTIPTAQRPEVGDHFRLSLYIRLDQSSQSSYYSNDMVFKGKPLSVEFVWQQGGTVPTAKYLANIIKKYEVAVYEKPIVKVEAEDSVLKIYATDQYQRFHTVVLEKYNAEAYHGMGEYTPLLKALPEKIGDGQGNYITNPDPEFNSKNFIKQGVEGFGTYEWLLHNLRLPTPARTGFAALNQDETPVPGAHYDEFVIKYCVNRGILGNNAVGDLVKSMTTHVFYVNHSVLKEFKDAIEATGVKVETVVSDYVKQLDAIDKPEHPELDKEGRD